MKKKRRQFDEFKNSPWAFPLMSCVIIAISALLISSCLHPVIKGQMSLIASIQHDPYAIAIPFVLSLVFFSTVHTMVLDLHKYRFGDLAPGTTSGFLAILAFWGAWPILAIATIVNLTKQRNFTKNAISWASSMNNGVKMSIQPAQTQRTTLDESLTDTLACWCDRYNSDRKAEYDAAIDAAQAKLEERQAAVEAAQQAVAQAHADLAELETQISREDKATVSRRLFDHIYHIDEVESVYTVKSSDSDYPQTIEVVFHTNYHNYYFARAVLSVNLDQSTNWWSCRIVDWDLQADQASLISTYINRFSTDGMLRADLQTQSHTAFIEDITKARNEGRLADLIGAFIDYLSYFPDDEKIFVKEVFSSPIQTS